MNHIVNTCPLTTFEGGLNLHHEAGDDAVILLESTATAAHKNNLVDIRAHFFACFHYPFTV